MNSKAFLRRLIVTTAVPPIVGIYRALYRLLIRAAVWRLKQVASIRAIYLRRGLAAGDGVPGISDIDLAVVGDWEAEAETRVTALYQRFARWCPLYDPTVGVYTPASIAELFQDDPFHRHRLIEGRREWKLLFGEDCLSHLGDVAEEEASFGYEAEMKLWWSYFARWACAAELRDQIFLNSLCYKVATECFRMNCALRGEPIPLSRRQAMDAAIASASPGNAAFLARLRTSAGGRHLRYSGNVVEDTQSYVLGLLEQTYGRLHDNPGWREIPGVSFRIDAPAEECLRSFELPQPAGVRVSSISAAAFSMDETVLRFEPISDGIPQASDLRGLVNACAHALPHSRSRVSLYLGLPNACYQFYASDFFRGWQAVLSPRFNPDVFLSSVWAGNPMPAWTRPAAEFIQRERQLMSLALDDPLVYKANNLDFLRTFWKFLELAVIEGTARCGEVVFAQTPEAVMRGLLQLHLPAAPFLERFAAAYREELRGNQADIGRHLPAAIQFLKNIHHEL